jgi:hypothetical protein
MVPEFVFLGLLFPLFELQYYVGIVSGSSLFQYFDSKQFFLAVSTSETQPVLFNYTDFELHLKLICCQQFSHEIKTWTKGTGKKRAF